MSFRTSTLLGLGAVLLLLAGCRTYGGHGLEPALIAQIHQANRLFADDLARARGNLSALQRAGGADSARQAALEQYAAVLTVHEALLSRHRAMAEEAEEHDGDYRYLARTYGAIISEQQIIKDRYDQFMVAVSAQPDTTNLVNADRPYDAVPPFYARLRNTNRLRTLNVGTSSAQPTTSPPAASPGQPANQQPGASPDQPAASQP